MIQPCFRHTGAFGSRASEFQPRRAGSRCPAVGRQPPRSGAGRQAGRVAVRARLDRCPAHGGWAAISGEDPPGSLGDRSRVKAAASAGRGAEGVIRIGILASVSGGFMRTLLGSYREHHPAIAIEIVEGSTSEHLARITERHLDVAFLAGTPLAAHCDTACSGRRGSLRHCLSITLLPMATRFIGSL